MRRKCPLCPSRSCIRIKTTTRDAALIHFFHLISEASSKRRKARSQIDPLVPFPSSWNKNTLPHAAGIQLRHLSSALLLCSAVQVESAVGKKWTPRFGGGSSHYFREHLVVAAAGPLPAKVPLMERSRFGSCCRNKYEGENLIKSFARAYCESFLFWEGVRQFHLFWRWWQFVPVNFTPVLQSSKFLDGPDRNFENENIFFVDTWSERSPHMLILFYIKYNLNHFVSKKKNCICQYLHLGKLPEFNGCGAGTWLPSVFRVVFCSHAVVVFFRVCFVLYSC